MIDDPYPPSNPYDGIVHGLRYEVDVTPYQTDHQQGWVDLAGVLDGVTLRDLTGYSQNSIRRINWDKFAAAVEATVGPTALTPVHIAHAQVVSGARYSPGECARRPTGVSCRIGAKARVGMCLLRSGSSRGARSLPSLQLRGDRTT